VDNYLLGKRASYRAVKYPPEREVRRVNNGCAFASSRIHKAQGAHQKMRNPQAKPRTWHAFAAAALAVIALGSTAAISVAGFSAQVVNNANTFSAGTMQLKESNGSINCYSTGSGSGGTVTSANSANCSINKLVGTLDQVPAGTPLTTAITMTNAGTINSSIESLVMGACSAAAASDANAYVGSDTAGFCGKVDFSIGTSTKCIYPANAAAACPATPTNTGNLGAVAGTTFTNSSTPPLILLTAGSSQAYTFTAMLDASATNTDQGLAASMTMTWNQS
jgi:hypothetical protein